MARVLLIRVCAERREGEVAEMKEVIGFAFQLTKGMCNECTCGFNGAWCSSASWVESEGQQHSAS
jgi:hypothetical protein